MWDLYLKLKNSGKKNCEYVLEVCVGLGLTRGPYQHMRGDFSNRMGQQMSGDFSNGTGRTSRAGKKRNEFFTSRFWLQKNKDEVLKPVDKRLIMNLFVGCKCKCANEICLPVSIKDFKQKSLIFFFIIECSTQSLFSLLFS